VKNLSSRVKSLRLDTDHSTPSSAEGKNVCLLQKIQDAFFEDIKKTTEVKDNWF